MRRLSISLLLSTLILGLCLNTVPVFAQSQEVLDHVEAARDYMKSRQWDYASFEWRSALKLEPKNVNVIVGLSESLLYSDYDQDAIKLLEEARQNSTSVELDVALAKAYNKQKNYTGAVALLQGILDKDPFYSNAYKGLMAISRKLTDEEKSLVEQKLTDIANQAKEKADSALKAARYSEAAKYYEIAGAYYRKPEILNDYGLALLLSGQNKDSLERFKNLDKSVKYWQVKSNTAITVLSVGNVSFAVKKMEEAIGLCPGGQNKAKLYNNLGYIYEAAGRPTKSRFAYEKATELEPSLTKAQLNLAYSYQQNYEYDKAVELYKGMLKHSPSDAMLWNRLGFVYELQYKPDLAISAYKKATELDSGLKDAYFNLGTLYKKMNKIDKASAAFKQVSEIEFKALENPKKDDEQEPYANLLKYVYVFFSDEG